MATAVERPPKFSLITAVYNVEPYLAEFIGSIEAQRIDPREIEIIAVDDGSTDGSLAILRTWAARARQRIRIVQKPNGGQASARNLGLSHATGEWVSFPDPDDMLEPDYLSSASAFARRHPRVEIMGTQPIILEERTGELLDHPRIMQYLGGDRVVDLRREPNTFPGGTNITLFKRTRLEHVGVRFDELLRPTLEDVHFTASFLLALASPIVGIVASARYIYRRRATNDSTLQGGWSHHGRYRVVPRRGHLDLLTRSRQRDGAVPEWLQQVIIYDLSWYFSEFEKPESGIRMDDDDVVAFEEALRLILPHLDEAAVAAHTVRRLKPIWADVLSYAFRPVAWHSAPVRSRVDRAARLQRITYRYNGDLPHEVFSIEGVRVNPTYAKTMRHAYFGITLLSERVVWLPTAGDLRVVIDGKAETIAKSWPKPGLWGLPPSLVKRVERYWTLARVVGLPAVGRRLAAFSGRVLGLPLRALAASWPYRARFENAWVLMDRYHFAGDNGERLFEYLRVERPDINAWFVIDGRSPDWARMRAAGHGRLIRYRSFRWKLLMLNCSWFISSHADAPIVEPPEILRILGRRRWRFAFLQHGVTQSDLSIWLNPKDIDLFVTSTQAETHSIVDDQTSYIYTEKEVRLTGMPRFDRLLAQARPVPQDQRDVVLICPTWRKWFTQPLNLKTRRRDISDAVWDSSYMRNWNAILRSRAIADAARETKRRIVFVPHPELQPLLERMSLPSHIEPFALAGNDVQALYGRCALMVTDYSSVAFDAAYLNRPIVYFQFDRDDILSGAHIGRAGYFEYERDGFGPVVSTVEEAEAAIVEAIRSGPVSPPTYQARIESTFARRDGRASERVVQAIEALGRPVVPSVIRAQEPAP